MWAKDRVKNGLKPFKNWLLGDTYRLSRQTAQLMGRLASWEVRSRNVVSSIQDVEFRVSSQWGQDGIIDWLIERADIPAPLRTFIEFGVEDYREANTRFLLQNRNWRGLIMDGSAAAMSSVIEDGLAWAHDLTVQTAFITRENINDQIASAGFRGEIGLLSIDIDGNDYWVWEAIQVVRPVIVVCEYNAVFGDLYPISIPYDRAFNRTQGHYSNLYFGASILALCTLGSQKGYRFVGTNSAANDAFFVREDYAGKSVVQAVERFLASPSLVRQSRNESGELDYIGGLSRFDQIADLPVVNVVTGETMPLKDLRPVYSAEWIEAMAGTSRSTENAGEGAGSHPKRGSG